MPRVNSERFSYANNITSLNIHKLTSLRYKSKDEKLSIPCIFLQPKQQSKKILIYFHANGEDIALTRNLLSELRTSLNINIIAPEYPKYGLYKSDQDIASTIEKDSLVIYDYLTLVIGFQEQNIIICGRSMGSGPSCFICSKRQPKAQILISAFTSIKSAVKSIVGNIASFFVNERFNNKLLIKNIQCPTLYIHGQIDELIPFKHSQELFRKSISKQSELIIQSKMTHVDFNYQLDIILPLKRFLFKIKFFN